MKMIPMMKNFLMKNSEMFNIEWEYYQCFQKNLQKDTYYIRFFSDGYLIGYIEYRDNYGPFLDILPDPKKLETS